MKLALFTDTLCDVNGVSRFLQDMERRARSSRRELCIFTSTLKSHCSPDGRRVNPSPVVRMPMPFYPQLDLTLPPFGRLQEAFEDFDPDLVHCSTPGPVGWWGKHLARKSGKGLVATYHTDFPRYLYDNTRSRWVESATYRMMRRFYRNFDRVLTRSSLYLPVLRERVGVDEDRSFVLRAGTDTERFHPRYGSGISWEELGVPEGGVKLLYVGRLSKEKNLPFLLEVWRRFRQRCPLEAQLLLVGNGTMQKCIERGEKEGIYYLGHREEDELSFCYAASDLFVTASVSETLGQTILEAMASATPVVVAAQGGQRDFVDDRCGRIVASMEIEAWVQALAELAMDAPRRARAGAEAFRRAGGMSIRRSFEEFWRLHQELLEAPPASG